jgi:hypothetical protein
VLVLVNSVLLLSCSRLQLFQFKCLIQFFCLKYRINCNPLLNSLSSSEVNFMLVRFKVLRGGYEQIYLLGNNAMQSTDVSQEHVA